MRTRDGSREARGQRAPEVWSIVQRPDGRTVFMPPEQLAWMQAHPAAGSEGVGPEDLDLTNPALWDLEPRARLRLYAAWAAENLVRAGYPGTANELRADPRGRDLLEGPAGSPEACDARALVQLADIIALRHRLVPLQLGRERETILVWDEDEGPVHLPPPADKLRTAERELEVEFEVEDLLAKRARLLNDLRQTGERVLRNLPSAQRRGGQQRAESYREADEKLRRATHRKIIEQPWLTWEEQAILAQHYDPRRRSIPALTRKLSELHGPLRTEIRAKKPKPRRP